MDILEKKIELLKNILNDSRYTVMLGGSGMMKEGGYQGLKSPEQAYETEKKYGLSPEDIFTKNAVPFDESGKPILSPAQAASGPAVPPPPPAVK